MEAGLAKFWIIIVVTYNIVFYLPRSSIDLTLLNMAYFSVLSRRFFKGEGGDVAVEESIATSVSFTREGRA